MPAQIGDLSVLMESCHEENDDDDDERRQSETDDELTDTTAVYLNAGPAEGCDGLVSSSDPEIVAARLSRIIQ